MKDTLAYYNNNADAFVESMFQVSMEELHLELLPQVPEDGNIPNAGSGLTEQGIKGAILPFLFFENWQSSIADPSVYDITFSASISKTCARIS